VLADIAGEIGNTGARRPAGLRTSICRAVRSPREQRGSKDSDSRHDHKVRCRECPKAVALLALKDGIGCRFHDVTVPLGGLQQHFSERVRRETGYDDAKPPRSRARKESWREPGQMPVCRRCGHNGGLTDAFT